MKLKVNEPQLNSVIIANDDHTFHSSFLGKNTS